METLLASIPADAGPIVAADNAAGAAAARAEDIMMKEPKSVCDLIGRWALKQPNHTAVLCESGRNISYRQLDDVSSRISWLLQQRQVRPGDLVPVLATRSIEMIASFLGILKAGACYVPIDIEAWSEERVQSTLKRVSARVVVNLGVSAHPDYDVISCHEVEAAFEPACEQKYEWEQPQSRIQPTDLAYLIFTSGTTSTPKGVMIPHRALLNYVQHGDEETPFNANAKPDDITLLIFSPGFDACTGLVFSMLCNGAQVMIPSTSDFLSCATRVTILTATPSVLAAIQDPQTCPQLRTIILGGEAPPPWLIEKWWAPGRNIYNGYGPTETTILALIGRVYPEKPITLGRSMPNSRVVLLDGDVESSHGEICITGPGLALGYYQDEAMTAQKFVYWQGERIYRTGDFARRTEHGLEFSGRADSFVKNRGFLVNLESQVIPMLLDAGALTATAFIHRDRLVAFVTPGSLDTAGLRQDLSRQHDAFLVPDHIRAVEALPLTVNGKADNRALEKLLEMEFLDSSDNVSLSGKRSKMEMLKAAISAATLLPVSEIAGDRSFFELGGNSLAGLKVLSYLQKRQLTVGLRALFDLPNLTAVCDAIKEGDPASSEIEDTFDNKEEYDKQEASSGPMTALQTRMIRASLRAPGANYMLLRIHIPHAGANLDQDRLRDSWRRILERHAIFRTTFLLRDELQVVQPELVLDWSSEETTADQLDAVIYARSLEINTRMLSVDEQSESFVPVNAFRLVTVHGIGSTLLISAHHAQADGWSLSIVLDEVSKVLDGQMPPQSSPQFMSVALAQKHQQTDPEGVSIWTDILQHYSAVPKLSLPKPSSNTNPSDWTSSLKIDLEFGGAKLEDGARILRVAPSALIYTAWGLVLSNYTFSDRVAFGVVFSGRNLLSVPGVERVVGPLLNTVPFPITFDQDEKQTVAATVSEINSRLLQMLEFQWSAAEAMASMDAESIDGIMQSIVVTEYDLPSRSGPWTIERQDLMEFGLSLLLEKDDDDKEDLQARMLFDSSRYGLVGIQSLLKNFKNALSELMNPQNKYIQDVRAKLMDEEEKLSLIQSGNTNLGPYTGPRTVQEAFEAAAAKWPQLCAVESVRHGSMTYNELEEASNRVARWLRQLYTHDKQLKDVVVAVLTDGSLYWVVSMLAILKAGCVGCSIDISLPPTRINTIVKQSGASIFLAANRRCAEVLQQRIGVGTVAVVNEFLQNSPDFSTGPVETLTKTEDTIYLVFTSGSTGVPKGVPLHNLSLLNVLDNPELRLFAGPGRRIAQLCGISFDVVLMEIFGSLCYGATLVLKDPTDPFEHLKRVNATLATPSFLLTCTPEDYGNLDTIMLVGEPVPQALADVWASRVHLLNGYGPCECGPITTTTRLLPCERVSIGRPLPRLNVYLLDHRKCLVPLGITGEIYVSGEQVTRGYWNVAAEQTETPFGPDHISSGSKHHRMYRTGDLAFWNDDMTLSYVGRLDHQVKVRGFRIELEEIERALLTAGGAKIQSAAAITVANDDHVVRIVAFVTPSGVDTEVLRAELVNLLPAYARPAQIVSISEMPKSPTFKVDRKALLALAASSKHEETGKDEGDASAELLSPTEKLISTIWKELLSLNNDVHLHRYDDFLAIGGNSLLAIKAARLITSAIGHHVPVALLIRETRLEELARAIDQHTACSSATSNSFSSYLSSGHQATLADYSSTASPLSYLEDDMFRAHAISSTKSAFHTTVQFVIQGDYNYSALVEAFTAVVRNNPILRARYVVSEGRPARFVSAEALAPQCYVGNELNRERLQALVDEPFDLAREQLFRVIIWIRNDINTETEVTMITHHLISDKASVGLTLQWIGRRYRDLTGSKVSSMKDHKVSHSKTKSHVTKGTYIDWAQWLQLHERNSFESQSQKQKNLEFWNQHLQGIQSVSQLRRFSCLGQDLGSTKSIHITTSEAVKLGHKFSQRLGVASTALALRAVFGLSDLVIGLPYMNRDDPSTADMLGLFVDQLPIRLLLNDANLASADALLTAVTAEINLAIAHQLPYVQIKSAIAPEDGYMNIVDVMVIYHWQSDAYDKSLDLGPDTKVLWRSGGTKPSGTLFSLLLEYREQEDGNLEIEIEYNTGVVSPETVVELTKCLQGAVKGLSQGILP